MLLQFYFYPAGVLETIFEDISATEGGSRAPWIEQQLAPFRLDAVAAYEAHRAGTIIGHTVAVIRSIPLAR